MVKSAINDLLKEGGLALSVGILVDEATVALENIHARMEKGDDLRRAALSGTTETAVPRLLAMLCILAVFVPAFFMVGAAKALFVPLALAVGFALIASFILSSTLVPILSVWLLRVSGNHSKEERAFSRAQRSYGRFVGGMVKARWLVILIYLIVAGLVIGVIGKRLGTDIFFPRRIRGSLRSASVGRAGPRLRSPGRSSPPSPAKPVAMRTWKSPLAWWASAIPASP